MLKPAEVLAIVAEHDAYWEQRRPRLREMRRLYMTRFWDNEVPRFDGILRTEVPKAYNTQIGDVLLTALVHAFCEWTGEDSLLLNLEGHGREEVVEGVDLSRTVGWFTTDFPVLLRDLGSRVSLHDVPLEPFSIGSAPASAEGNALPMSINLRRAAAYSFDSSRAIGMRM